MAGRKKIRTRGKLQLSRYFQNLKEGDSVAVIKEPSVDSNFPPRLQGRAGSVIEKRGRAYVIKIMDHDKEKRFIIKPIHLKKIERNRQVNTKMSSTSVADLKKKTRPSDAELKKITR